MWRIRYALQVLKDDRGIGVDIDPGGSHWACYHLQIPAYQSGADNL